jgi:hypothetical protein
VTIAEIMFLYIPGGVDRPRIEYDPEGNSDSEYGYYDFHGSRQLISGCQVPFALLKKATMERAVEVFMLMAEQGQWQVAILGRVLHEYAQHTTFARADVIKHATRTGELYTAEDITTAATVWSRADARSNSIGTRAYLRSVGPDATMMQEEVFWTGGY